MVKDCRDPVVDRRGPASAVPDREGSCPLRVSRVGARRAAAAVRAVLRALEELGRPAQRDVGEGGLRPTRAPRSPGGSMQRMAS